MAAAVEDTATPPPPSSLPPAEEPTYKPISPTEEEEETHPQPELEATASASAASSSSLAGHSTGESTKPKDRDEALAKVNQDRTYSHIRAWEENQKSKSVNKFNKMIAKINAWENTKKATAEANLKNAEETLEKKRAAYVEKMKNEIAAVHRSAEEQRAIAESRKGEEFVKADESAAKFRAHGHMPKKFLCFTA